MLHFNFALSEFRFALFVMVKTRLRGIPLPTNLNYGQRKSRARKFQCRSENEITVSLGQG